MKYPNACMLATIDAFSDNSFQYHFHSQVRERKQSAGTSFPNSCPLRISIEHLLTFALQASTSLAPTATAHLYKFQGSGKYFSICQNISVPFLTALIDPTDCYALFCRLPTFIYPYQTLIPQATTAMSTSLTTQCPSEKPTTAVEITNATS